MSTRYARPIAYIISFDLEQNIIMVTKIEQEVIFHFPKSLNISQN